METVTQTTSYPKSLRWVPLPQPVVLPSPSDLIIRTGKESDGLPCRRCLSDGKAGDTMYLISYNPFSADAKHSPYQGPGPIFIHAYECVKYLSNEVSEQQRKRLLSVRAYDRKHMIVNHATLEGDKLVEKASQMLEDEEVGYVHVHYSGPGCFAVRVERGLT